MRVEASITSNWSIFPSAIAKTTTMVGSVWLWIFFSLPNSFWKLSDVNDTYFAIRKCHTNLQRWHTSNRSLSASWWCLRSVGGLPSIKPYLNVWHANLLCWNDIFMIFPSVLTAAWTPSIISWNSTLTSLGGLNEVYAQSIVVISVHVILPVQCCRWSWACRYRNVWRFCIVGSYYLLVIGRSPVVSRLHKPVFCDKYVNIIPTPRHFVEMFERYAIRSDSNRSAIKLIPVNRIRES